MLKKGIILFFLVCICLSAWAEDSIQVKRPQFVAVNLMSGFVMPTKKITSHSYEAPFNSALTLKYGFKARGDKWKDYLYRLPYGGIGFYLPRYSMRKELGDPFSVFLFQGARFVDINPKVSFNYEINLGASFNWNHYDRYSNPEYIALGSPTNVHLGGNFYFKWRLSNRFDLHTGLNITHFSNGALRTPNNGLNSLSAFVELAYNIHDEKKKNLADAIAYPKPTFEKRTAHDISLLYTTRTLKIDTAETHLKSKYPKKRFNVTGISYSYMLHNTHRFKWGPSIELTYDESINATFWGDINPVTGQYTEYYKLSKTADRFTAGLSLKGEVDMPGFSIFMNMGCDILHKDNRERRLYQIYGLKIYFIDNLFATFGVRSTNMAHSQYLYLNIGYTFERYRKK